MLNKFPGDAEVADLGSMRHVARQLMLGQPLTTERGRQMGSRSGKAKNPFNLMKGVVGLILMSQPLQASVSHLGNKRDL